MRDVSVIGLGVMGAALAGALLENGYRVTVWNRSPAKAEPLVAAGAELAPSARDAIAASSATIVCIRTHSDTRALLEADPEVLSDATIIELSTGDAPEAESLVSWIREQGGECLVGMISSYPSGIGKEETAIVTVGAQPVWERCEAMMKTLGGKSTYIGERISSLAVIYSALFLPRQGFMFGMLYGALICEKAGVPLESYVEQIPLTLKVTHDYYDVFAASVPTNDFADPPASIDTYAAAFRDVLASFRDLGLNREFPELLNDIVQRGIEAGYGDEQLTALIKVLR